MTPENSQRAKETLIQWAEGRNITPSDFRTATGYSYQHAWNLLRGTLFPTQETVARMLNGYGAEAAQLISDALNGADAHQNSIAREAIGGQDGS